MTLERNEFQRLLFRIAFCVMACDGNIDEREIQEIKAMNNSAAYFQGIDLSEELKGLLASLNERGKQYIDDLLNNIPNIDLTIVQELLILEVALRIVNADKRMDEHEINFLKVLRSKLKVYDEMIRDRFGAVEYFFNKDYSKDVASSGTRKDEISAISIPELKDIQAIDFSNFNDTANEPKS